MGKKARRAKFLKGTMADYKKKLLMECKCVEGSNVKLRALKTQLTTTHVHLEDLLDVGADDDEQVQAHLHCAMANALQPRLSALAVDYDLRRGGDVGFGCLHAALQRAHGSRPSRSLQRGQRLPAARRL